ncbi:Gp49 family protein [Maricaulis sp.]|uniref:Gp49 family protein n=1 Tax=Maricaulis sp. TaxID=1486257 RepID=UPI0032981981
MDSLEVTDAQSAAVQKTPNRVTLESIKGKIVSEEYLHPACLPSMTIAVLELANGYVVTGQAAPADPANFNEDLGRKFAYEDAVRRIWPLEGYALRERLTEAV